MKTGTVQQIDGNGNAIPGLVIQSTWPVTHSHATAADATLAGVAATRHVITGYIVYSDKATAVVNVKQDTTVLYTTTFTAAGEKVLTFPTPIALAVGTAAHVTIDGTASAKANMFGYTLIA